MARDPQLLSPILLISMIDLFMSCQRRFYLIFHYEVTDTQPLRLTEGLVPRLAFSRRKFAKPDAALFSEAVTAAEKQAASDVEFG